MAGGRVTGALAVSEAPTVSLRLADSWAGADPSVYVPSGLHGADRVWTETNCYTDLWIELLHGSGFDPRPMLSVCLASGFDGSQWSFVKPSAADLRDLYGVDVAELRVWRTPLDHAEELLARGVCLAVEVDAYHLPDTVGVSYRSAHVKTAIVPCQLDRVSRQMRYLHGAGYHQLDGDDFDGLWEPPLLPPYTEAIRMVPGWQQCDQRACAVDVASGHLSRAPADNPVERMGRAVGDTVGWLQEQTVEVFHEYAFGTCRQAGASAELCAGFFEWLGAGDPGPDPVRHFTDAAMELKALQFALARATRGRSVDLESTVAAASKAWQRAMADAAEVLGTETGQDRVTR